MKDKDVIKAARTYSKHIHLTQDVAQEHFLAGVNWALSQSLTEEGLKELYRKGYNDGRDQKADRVLVTDLVQKRINRVREDYTYRGICARTFSPL